MENRPRNHLCKAGKHFHFRKEVADRCPTCRRMLDTGVRRYFRRMSDRMLRAA